jgi:Spy/CpxP family protein refolding chaperone
MLGRGDGAAYWLQMTRQTRNRQFKKGETNMKTFTRVLVSAALAAAALSAQGRMGMGGGTPPDPATVVAQRVARLTTLLTLTAQQQTQATTIFTTATTSAQSIQTSIATAEQALQAAVKNGLTAEITHQATAIGTLHGQALDIQSRADAAFYAILTADQKTKLDQAGPMGGGRGMGMGRGGMMGMGRGPRGGQ